MKEQRCVLITGATGQLGEKVARSFLEQGDTVVLSGRNADRLDQLVEIFSMNEGRVETRVADVTRPEEAEVLAAHVEERYGRIDCLIHLVGQFYQTGPLAPTQPEVWNKLFEANVLSAAFMAQAVLPRMVKYGSGKVVFVSSLLGEEPMPGSGPYAASKAALVALARALSREVKDHQVNVNVAVTSLVDTPKLRQQMPFADFSKWVDPNDLAQTIQFLCSNEARSIHGARIPVYGTFALEIPGGGPAPGIGRPNQKGRD